MHLVEREPTLEDFDDFYWNCFQRDRENQELRDVVEHEWRTFHGHPAALTIVVKDLDLEPRSQLVCCAQSVFVTDKFVEWARSAAEPWVIRTAARRLPDGSVPLITAAEVEEGCTERGSLNSLVTRWGRGDQEMPIEYRRCVHDFRQRAFINVTSGYRFGRILCESVGATAVRNALGAGFRLWTDYSEYFRVNPPAPPDDRRPYLSGITRDEAEEMEGSLMSHFFAFRPRLLRLTRDERELVQHALMGETEQVTAAAIGQDVHRVKYRWRVLYDKIEDRHPALFASFCGTDATTDHRGKEKRRVLLAYLRDHPEELRRTLE